MRLQTKMILLGSVCVQLDTLKGGFPLWTTLAFLSIIVDGYVNRGVSN